MSENTSEFQKSHRCPECTSEDTTVLQSHNRFFINCKNCNVQSPIKAIKKAA
jgi:transcription elongation factor Elf1